MKADEVARPSDVYWDPFDYDLHANPHPTWRRMREEAPLYRNDKFDFWALSRFDDVWEALVDWKTYSSAKGPILELIQMGITSEYAEVLECKDPPTHTVQRQLLARAFSPKAIKKIEDRVRGYAQHLLDERIGSGGFDFVDDFGALVPAMVIASMLGTPDSDIDEIRHLTDAQFVIEEDNVSDRSTFDDISAVLGEYFMGHVRARRKNPTDDIMSALVTMEFTDEHGVTRQLTDMEACQYIFILSAAGNETTARHLGWVGSSLAQYPDQRAKLVANPDLIPNAVEEILRYESPSMALARVTTKDVTWYDQVVPEGSTVVLIQASTGRDQRAFPDPDPDTLDVERKIERHISFGFGIHVCMGASLARLESRIAIEETLRRFPEWDVKWDETEIVHLGSTVRGYRKLPIYFR
jgi:cytochrome P450